MPFNIGPGELLLILAIALLVIGPGRLPDVGAALGKSLREFRKASTEMQDAVTSATAQPSRSATGPAVAAAPAAPAAPSVPAVSAAIAAPASPGMPGATPTSPAAPPTDGLPAATPTATSGSPEADAESTPGA